MQLEPHSLTHLSLHLDPTPMRCRDALSGDAGGFAHTDQQPHEPSLPGALKSGVFESYYAHPQKLGPFRPFVSVLKLDNSTKKKSLD